LRSFMNRMTKGGRIPAWFLQLDIKSYFMSIDREILLNIVAGKVRDQALLALARTIVTHDCTGNYLLKGSPALHAKVPPGKSLFTVAPGKGLPIGNLTSQFFANVYLNELDQFVKHELKVRFYLRYMDDFILLAHSPETLLEMKGRIEDFLGRQLKLSLKSGHILKRVNEGADFLGYIVRPDYQLCRQRVVGNLKEKLGDFEKKLTGAGAVGRDRYTALNLYAAELAALRQTLASYLGHFEHANCRRLVFGLFERYAWLKEIFSFDPEGYRLVPRYEPPFTPASFREQYGWFAGACPGCCLFVQVGRFFELHTSQAVEFGPRFGLKPAPGRAGVRCGFPVGMLRTFKDKARRARISYVVVGERGRYGAGLKKRVVTEKLIFGGASSPIPAIVSC
ncbi:MAG: RNA-directed DNA polymerase, partial [Desulfobulbales bacterium]|nr:RNA-directed DNA polymerase [Desulfobulbales bacterium]